MASNRWAAFVGVVVTVTVALAQDQPDWRTAEAQFNAHQMGLNEFESFLARVSSQKSAKEQGEIYLALGKAFAKTSAADPIKARNYLLKALTYEIPAQGQIDANMYLGIQDAQKSRHKPRDLELRRSAIDRLFRAYSLATIQLGPFVDQGLPAVNRYDCLGPNCEEFQKKHEQEVAAREEALKREPWHEARARVKQLLWAAYYDSVPSIDELREIARVHQIREKDINDIVVYLESCRASRRP